MVKRTHAAGKRGTLAIMRYLDGLRPRVFGHRGAAGVAPENTMPSFAAAIEAGADRLELDVHASADGHVVVFHDATLERTTNGVGPLRERSLAELQALDAGHAFRGSLDTGHASRAQEQNFPFRGRGLRIPTLAEVCAAFPGVPLNIEIKQDAPAIEGAVLAVLDAHGGRERALLAAEADGIMARIRAAAPGALTGFSTGEAMEFIGRRADPTYRPQGVALQVPPTYGDFVIITAELVAAAHALGVEVHAWTINDEAEMDRLLDLGIDGLFTDFPGRAAAVRRRRAA
jgi:glycerophosphoryl diester phosphodiesterase